MEKKGYHVVAGSQWLKAIDPLVAGGASRVRSRWVSNMADATEFDSRGYAEEVAQRAPFLWRIEKAHT